MPQPVEIPDKIYVGPVIDEGHSLASVSDKEGGIVLKRKITLGWTLGLFLAFGLLQGLAAGAVWLFTKGVGVWGINIPNGWGFAIINFVWWIGIGHAGTLISAILLLLNQSWRNAINRFAEAMTLFAVMCAGMFPVLHTGRPWLAYWLFPYPNTMDLWPQCAQPSALGRVRRLDLLHDLGRVLVRWSSARSGYSARHLKEAVAAESLRNVVDGLAWFHQALAEI